MSKELELTIFKEYDSNNDGKLSLEQFEKLLKTLGYNIYIATLRKDLRYAISPHHLYQTQNFIEGIDFQTAQKYIKSRSSPISRFLWRQNYQLRETEAQLKDSLGQRDLKTIRDRQLSGSIQIHFDKQERQYDTQINACVKKFKKSVPFPTIDTTLTSKQKEDCKKIQENLNQIIKSIKQMAIGQDPSLQADLGLVHHVISIDQEKRQVNLHIQIKIPEIIDFQTNFCEFLDRLLQNKIETKIKVSYKTNNKLSQYLKQQTQLSLFDFTNKKTSVYASWQTGQFISALKQLLLAQNVLSNLSFNRADIKSLLVLGFINSQNINAVFQFQSNKQQESNQKTQVEQEMEYQRKQLYSMAIESFTMINGLQQFKVADLIKMIDQKIHINVNFGSMVLQLQIKIRQLNKIIIQLLQSATTNPQPDSD